MVKVIYEDNHIIVVEKPVNIPSQGDKTGDEDMLSLVKQYIKEKYRVDIMEDKLESCIENLFKKYGITNKLNSLYSLRRRR